MLKISILLSEFSRDDITFDIIIEAVHIRFLLNNIFNSGKFWIHTVNAAVYKCLKTNYYFQFCENNSGVNCKSLRFLKIRSGRK